MACGLLQPSNSSDMRPSFSVDDIAHGGLVHSESFGKYRLFGSRGVASTNFADGLVREFRPAVQFSSHVVDRGVQRVQDPRGMLLVLLVRHPLQIVTAIVARVAVVVITFMFGRTGTDEGFEHEMVDVVIDHRTRRSISKLNTAVSVFARPSRKDMETPVSYSPVIADFVPAFMPHNRSPLFFRHPPSLTGVC